MTHLVGTTELVTLLFWSLRGAINTLIQRYLHNTS